jgi:hypothetical protein
LSSVNFDTQETKLCSVDRLRQTYEPTTDDVVKSVGVFYCDAVPVRSLMDVESILQVHVASGVLIQIKLPISVLI